MSLISLVCASNPPFFKSVDSRRKKNEEKTQKFYLSFRNFNEGENNFYNSNGATGGLNKKSLSVVR